MDTYYRTSRKICLRELRNLAVYARSDLSHPPAALIEFVAVDNRIDVFPRRGKSMF